MKTPITYYGGKQRMVDKILPLIPAHRIYCEPYFGGGAIFFAKGKSYCEVINDIDDRIITFYDVCQDSKLFAELQQRIQMTLSSEKLFLRADTIWRNTKKAKNKVELAWAVWLQCNMGFGGSPDGGWKWDNGTSGSHSGVRMDNYRKQFTYKIHERLKYVQISCRDALKVINQRDSKETFFFLDPPYPGCVQKHYSGFTFDHFRQLLDLLTVIKGKFILCNFPSEMLNEYIKKAGWFTEVFDMSSNVCNIRKKGARKQEVIVYNYLIEPTLF